MPARRILLLLGTAAALALSLASAQAAPPGTLDPSFGQRGEVTTDFGPGGGGDEGNEAALAIALQPDGKIVVAGGANFGDFALARYKRNGSPDTTFGPLHNGTVTTDLGSEGAAAVALQPDGKIVAVGYADPGFGVARYLADGSLDPTFGDGGTVVTTFDGNSDAQAVRIESGGKILVVGGGPASGSVALARYNPDGSLDTAFGDAGTSVTDEGVLPYRFAFQPDGKIVVAGYAPFSSFVGEFGLARLNADGTLDRSFGNNGIAVVQIGSESYGVGVALQQDGKIVEGGFADASVPAVTWSFALARFTSDGQLDSTFGEEGTVTNALGQYNLVTALAVDASGRIIAGGDSHPAFTVLRYQPDGSLDQSFGSGGAVRNASGAAEALAIQPDGRIIAAGSVALGGDEGAFLTARYLGSADDVVCTVPALTGRRLVVARKMLANAQCGLGRLHHAFSRRHRRGVVVGQTALPGALKAAGARVGLTVSKGRRHPSRGKGQRA